MNDQVSPQETTEIMNFASQCLSNSGDYVEFGCYKGATTVLLGKMLAELAPDKHLYAYDSFAGLPSKTREDDSSAGRDFQEGELAVSKREVVGKIRRAGLRNVIIKKAWFDQLDPEDLPGEIAFAFIDGDFYESQKVALELVVPRLTKGGIIICHDYNNPDLPGASQAVDEFLQNYPEYQIITRQTLAILALKR